LELGLRRSVEILGTVPLRLGQYTLGKSIGQQPDPHRSSPMTVNIPDTVSSQREESKPKAFQAYTEVPLC
jgi:hypothetical protein